MLLWHDEHLTIRHLRGKHEFDSGQKSLSSPLDFTVASCLAGTALLSLRSQSSLALSLNVTSLCVNEQKWGCLPTAQLLSIFMRILQCKLPLCPANIEGRGGLSESLSSIQSIDGLNLWYLVPVCLCHKTQTTASDCMWMSIMPAWLHGSFGVLQNQRKGHKYGMHTIITAGASPPAVRCQVDGILFLTVHTLCACQVSAPPGYSEHHTGYALDMGDADCSDTHLEYGMVGNMLHLFRTMAVDLRHSKQIRQSGYSHAEALQCLSLVWGGRNDTWRGLYISCHMPKILNNSRSYLGQ